MKIALCISGHFKYYNDIYKNFLDLLYTPLTEYGEVDVFISTWSSLHTEYSASYLFGHCKEQIGETNIEDIQSKYKARKVCVKNYNAIKNEFHYKKIFSEDKPYAINRWLIKNDIYIPIGMFYQWKLCNDLKLQHEHEMGNKYDLVIRMRPDMFFLKKFTLPKNLDLKNFYLQTQYADWFFMSSSSRIDTLCNIYPTIPNIIKEHFNEKFEWFCPYSSEFLLQNYFKNNNISIEERITLDPDLFMLYPRNLFFQFCYEILRKAGREKEMPYLFKKYPLPNFPFPIPN